MIWTLTLNHFKDTGIVLKCVERLFKHVFWIDVLDSKQIQHHAVSHTKRAQQRIRLALESHKRTMLQLHYNNWALKKETITSLYATINITKTSISALKILFVKCKQINDNLTKAKSFSLVIWQQLVDFSWNTQLAALDVNKKDWNEQSQNEWGNSKNILKVHNSQVKRIYEKIFKLTLSL